MKKPIIGYIYTGQNLTSEEIIALELLKNKNFELIFFNVSKKLKISQIKDKIIKCDLFYNSTGEDYAIEFVKIIEGMGKKVIDSSECYFNNEDKWKFFIKCKEDNISTPKTILLADSTNEIKKQLDEFDQWPVIIKRSIGTMGEYVEKADNIEQVEQIIKKFKKREEKENKRNKTKIKNYNIQPNNKIHLIAQEFIKSPSYRVTIINNKILQTAIKKNKGWKSIGVYGKKFEKFAVDKELKKIVDKIINVTKMNICGIDFLKKGNKWVALEVNSAPAFDFFKDEEKMLVEAALDCVAEQAQQNANEIK